MRCAVCAWSAKGVAWDIAQSAALTLRKADGKGKRLPLLNLTSILAYEPNPKDEIWPGGILSAGDATALVGAPGVGKSRLALQGALCTILGQPFLGWETRGQGLKWLFLQTENSTRRLRADLVAMTRHFTTEAKAAIDESMRVLNVAALEFGSICMVEGHPDRVRIEATIADFAPDIVVIDPLRDAGKGDPNKDADMLEACQSIGAVMRAGNPRRVPMVVHHGRTGAAEASRVFGDDAASFARNSKVLYGWLRSQINVASAGANWPDTVIFGCGKTSNGPRWEPFAARLDPHIMTYERLTAEEFDLDEWCECMVSARARKIRVPTPQEVAQVVTEAGGEVHGGKNKPDGLVRQVMRTYKVSRATAMTAVEGAEGETIEHRMVSVARKQGGVGPKVYVLRRVEGR